MFSGRILPCNVVLELLDGLLLLGDDPLDQVANRDHANDVSAFYDRKVSCSETLTQICLALPL